MAMQKREPVTFRDVAIIFKNFAGEAKKYNRPGDRNFSIMMGEKDAQMALDLGFKVKELRRQEEDTEQLYHLKVKVSFDNKPPRCWLVTGRGTKRTMIGEGMVAMFDDLDAVKVDLEVSPYQWKMDSGETGITAYLSTFFFHLLESDLELEYAGVEQEYSTGTETPPKALEGGVSRRYDFEGDVVDEDERR